MSDQGRRLYGPASPAEVARLSRDLSRRYTFYLREDLRRFRLRPWWATGTQGIGNYSELVWHARSRERLEAKLTRFARRDMLSRGVRGEPEVRFEYESVPGTDLRGVRLERPEGR